MQNVISEILFLIPQTLYTLLIDAYYTSIDFFVNDIVFKILNDYKLLSNGNKIKFHENTLNFLYFLLNILAVISMSVAYIFIVPIIVILVCVSFMFIPCVEFIPIFFLDPSYVITRFSILLFICVENETSNPYRVFDIIIKYIFTPYFYNYNFFYFLY